MVRPTDDMVRQTDDMVRSTVIKTPSRFKKKALKLLRRQTESLHLKLESILPPEQPASSPKAQQAVFLALAVASIHITPKDISGVYKPIRWKIFISISKKPTQEHVKSRFGQAMTQTTLFLFV